MSQRRYELDWLRVLVVLLLIYYHSARVFDMGDFYVKNVPLSKLMEGFVAFADLWGMPLLFFIAGAAASFSLKKRSSWQFLSERVKRLLVPFVFGMLVVVPPQVFCVYLQKPGNPASYISFWKYQFSVPPLTQITAGKVGDALITAYTWEMGHLWFILYLLIFSAAALPLLRSIREGNLRGPSARLAAFCERRSWGIFLFAIPIMFATTIAMTLDMVFQRLFLVVPFVLGCLVYSSPSFGKAIDVNRRKALLLAILTTVALLATVAIGDYDVPGSGLLLWGPWIGLEMWLWLVALVGIARNLLNFKNRVLEYASEGSYPFYILHQTIIVALALGIVEISAPVLVKYLLLTTASLVLTLACYDMLIRRWGPVRFLFGMNPKEQEVGERH